MENDLISKVYKINLKELRNKKVCHKKILICFSGIPGSGKSTLAKILEKRYKGIRIDNNWARKHFIKTRNGNSDNYAKDVDDFVRDYLDYFLKNYNFSNKLFILDSSIDRKYNRIKKFANKNRFKMFVITLEISKRIAQERAFERKGSIDYWFVKNINRWVKEFNRFNKKHKSDFVINNEKKSSLNPLFDKLDLLIN